MHQKITDFIHSSGITFCPRTNNFVAWKLDWKKNKGWATFKCILGTVPFSICYICRDQPSSICESSEAWLIYTKCYWGKRLSLAGILALRLFERKKNFNFLVMTEWSAKVWPRKLLHEMCYGRNIFIGHAALNKVSEFCCCSNLMHLNHLWI